MGALGVGALIDFPVGGPRGAVAPDGILLVATHVNLGSRVSSHLSKPLRLEKAYLIFAIISNSKPIFAICSPFARQM